MAEPDFRSNSANLVGDEKAAAPVDSMERFSCLELLVGKLLHCIENS